MAESSVSDQLHDCEYATDPRVNKDLAASLKDKNVVIAGAGRGIGRATAEFFAHTQAKSLSLMAVELNEVNDTAKACKAISPTIITKTAGFDVRDYDKVQLFIDEVDHDFGGVDVLFMNAGRPPQFLPTHESDPQVWWDTVAVSLQGAFNFSRAVLPIMRRDNNGGRIVFTASSGAHLNQGISSYTLGKLGMVRLCEILHFENKDCGIKAFAIHPGTIRTRFLTDFQDAAQGKVKPGSYVSQELPPDDEKSAKTAVDIFKNVSQWDAPEMPAGLVVTLASGQLDFMSGRYLDATRRVGAYMADKEDIFTKDLHRVRLIEGNGVFIPQGND